VESYVAKGQSKRPGRGTTEPFVGEPTVQSRAFDSRARVYHKVRCKGIDDREAQNALK